MNELVTVEEGMQICLDNLYFFVKTHTEQIKELLERCEASETYTISVTDVARPVVDYLTTSSNSVSMSKLISHLSLLLPGVTVSELEERIFDLELVRIVDIHYDAQQEFSVSLAPKRAAGKSKNLETQ